ncbi:hypothetical protein Purlil1_990 [Purpureocillium lilacinum]|uniref:Uncharacterized protein n=1 Tax=Purpureocillium lilacinum TaxID=33203 RepID=A0ABR0CE30_PURLI|nr:hypothetical protein Purlil1_990 [Purpureocillium lilacinum]
MGRDSDTPTRLAGVVLCMRRQGRASRRPLGSWRAGADASWQGTRKLCDACAGADVSCRWGGIWRGKLLIIGPEIVFSRDGWGCDGMGWDGGWGGEKSMGEGSGRKKGQLTASEVRQGKARQTTRARWRMERRRGVGWAGRAAQDWLVGLVGRWSRAACLGGGASQSAAAVVQRSAATTTGRRGRQSRDGERQQQQHHHHRADGGQAAKYPLVARGWATGTPAPLVGFSRRALARLRRGAAVRVPARRVQGCVELTGGAAAETGREGWRHLQAHLSSGGAPSGALELSPDRFTSPPVRLGNAPQVAPPEVA